MIIFAGAEPKPEHIRPGFTFMQRLAASRQFSDSLHIPRAQSNISEIHRICDFVEERWKSGKAKAVFLGGFGTTCSLIAKTAEFLEIKKIPVDCLILCDPTELSYGVSVVNTVKE